MGSLLHDAPIAQLNLVCPTSCCVADWVHRYLFYIEHIRVGRIKRDI